MLLEILWFVLIGLTVAFLAQMLMVPWGRPRSSWGVFSTALIGALLIGFLIPGDGLFAAPFLFWGTILFSLLGSLLFVWFIGLLIYLTTPETTVKS